MSQVGAGEANFFFDSRSSICVSERGEEERKIDPSNDTYTVLISEDPEHQESLTKTPSIHTSQVAQVDP